MGIDIEGMNNFLEKMEKPIFVYSELLINYEDFLKLKQLRKKYGTRVEKCIEPIEIYNQKFIIEYKCDNCGKIEQYSLSKTKLLELIHPNKNRKMYCLSCTEKIKEKEKKEQIEKEQNTYKIVEEQKNVYVDAYLDENAYYNKPLKNIWYDEFNRIRFYLIMFNAKEIKDLCDLLDYKDYLKTPYWKMTSYYKKRKSGFMCELCGNKKNLNVHHKTYEHKGCEILYLNDLIVLCKNCHEKFHFGGE